ncbi:MAG: hypothetical protein HYW23_04410 [Candidatus Aenigmarchaeota archaeon]|nr:hypothetical protein [Candidatus Aenigmarchaeota archaeon]
MKIKISATFLGKCSVCKKKVIVFTAGDEDSQKTASICKECADRLGSESTEQLIQDFGVIDKESFKQGIKFEKKPRAG